MENSAGRYKNTMTAVLLELTRSPLILKKTNNIYCDNTCFFKIERVNSYYVKNNKKYTWLKLWRGNVFIYGNPFSGYSF
jgi:hypothetical protein